MRTASLTKRQWVIILIILALLPRVALAYINRDAYVGDFPLMVRWSEEGFNSHELAGTGWVLYAQLAKLIAGQNIVVFLFLMKLFAIIGDALIVLTLFLVTDSLKWSLLFVLSPVAILVSAGIGHIDTLTLFPLLASLSLLKHRKYVLAGLLSGVGITLKFYPVFFIGIIGLYLLRNRITSWQRVIAYGISAIGVYLLWLIILSLFGGNTIVLAEFLDYSAGGTNTDLGLLQMLHNLGLPIRGMGGASLPGLWGEWFSRGKLLFGLKILFGCWVLFFLYRFQFDDVSDVLVYFLICFYTFLGGTAMEYLVWILPFGFYRQRKDVLAFSLIAFPALLSFIMYKYPDFLVRDSLPFQPTWQAMAALTNAIYVIFVFIWFAYTTRTYWLASRNDKIVVEAI